MEESHINSASKFYLICLFNGKIEKILRDIIENFISLYAIVEKLSR